jgi:hypothetical protein
MRLPQLDLRPTTVQREHSKQSPDAQKVRVVETSLHALILDHCSKEIVPKHFPRLEQLPAALRTVVEAVLDSERTNVPRL